MHRLLALLFLMMPLSGFAARWSPYVGALTEGGTIYPLVNFKNLNNSNEIGPLSGFASQFETGLTWKSLDVFAAYRFASPIPTSWDDAWYRTDANQLESGRVIYSWREKQCEIGGRWYMNGESSARVKPTVGLALTYGRSRLIQEDIGLAEDNWGGSYESWHITQSRWSRGYLGAALELGFLIHTGVPVDVSVLTRISRYEAYLGDDHMDWTDDRFVVVGCSMQLGLRYVFHSLSIGK